MRFTIKTPELKKAMKRAAGVGSPNVSVLASSSVVSFGFASDSMMLRTAHPCCVDEGGLETIPNRLLGASSNFDGSQVEVAALGGNVLVTCDGFRAQSIASTDTDWADSIDKKIETGAVEFELMDCRTMNAAELARAVNFSLLAAGTKCLNPMMNGVLFESRDGLLHVVGLDEGKMAVDNLGFDAPECTAVIPRYAAQVLASLLKDCPDAIVSFGISGDLVGFVGGGIQFFVRPIKEGSVPDWRGHIDLDGALLGRFGVETSRVASSLKLLKASGASLVDVFWDGARVLRLSSVGDSCSHEIPVSRDVVSPSERNIQTVLKTHNLLAVLKELKKHSSLGVRFFGQDPLQERAEIVSIRPQGRDYPVLFLSDELPPPLKPESQESQE